MTARNHPTHIEDPGEISLKIEGYTLELGTHLWGPAMNLPSHIARWLSKELAMMAADVDRKAARDMCDNAERVMTR
jgi:hypothetical protein